MIALVLYPYLFLIFKTALREQSFKLVQASQLMGLSPWQSFFKVSLVLSRGAIVAALALISMETMADFATVSTKLTLKKLCQGDSPINWLACTNLNDCSRRAVLKIKNKYG